MSAPGCAEVLGALLEGGAGDMWLPHPAITAATAKTGRTRKLQLIRSDYPHIAVRGRVGEELIPGSGIHGCKGRDSQEPLTGGVNAALAADDAAPEGHGHRLRAGVHAELLQHRGDVMLDGLWGTVQSTRHLRARAALRE